MGFLLLMLSLAGGGIGIAAAAGGSSSRDPDPTPVPPTPAAPSDASAAPDSPAAEEDAPETDPAPVAESGNSGATPTPDPEPVPEADRPANTTPDPVVVPVVVDDNTSDDSSQTPVVEPPANDPPAAGDSDPATPPDDSRPDSGTGSSDPETPADETAAGPCPVTGDPVCHCNEDDDDTHNHAASGPCPVTSDPVCHCNDDEEDEDDGHSGHAGHGGAEPSIPVPVAGADAAAIDAYVQAVKDSPEDGGFHADHAGLHTEHMAVMDLVPRDEATHVAIGSGDWNDPDNWHNGVIPGDDAKVLIPEGIKITYSGDNEAELFTLRVDGELDFATDADSTLIVDTFVVAPSGTLTIGTEDDPIQDDVDVNIVFANNGPIDTDWDPSLLSRGLISHGKVDIHGQEKDSHEKVIEDPVAGDTSIAFGTIPTGWEVGDTIVIAGTRYEGYYNNDSAFGYVPPEDEERVITQIDEDGRIHFEEPLIYDHDAPREDLATSVANYSRNVTFETEDADTAEVFERGHVMFMHNNDVEVRFAAFTELGRTDKSEDSFALNDLNKVNSDSNIQGRYSLHLHRTGTQDQDNPAIVEGNAVYGSPGWGFVHHDSHAILQNNASYDTFGAGYVAESGSETGVWNDNIAIFAQGESWNNPKSIGERDTFDFGRSGDGFWFQGRQVESTDNVAASVHNGFIYFHRGLHGDTDNVPFDSATTDIEGAFYYDDGLRPGLHPILGFNGNEAFAAKTGLHVVKANFVQNHDVYSVLEDFTAWDVRTGANLSYTGHYILDDFDLISREDSSLATNVNSVTTGIDIGRNTLDLTIVDSNLEGFDVGIDLEKRFINEDLPSELHQYVVINPTFADVGEEFKNYDATLDQILEYDDLPNLAPDIELDGPLTYDHQGSQEVVINGTKSDSLGTIDFPTQAEDFSLSASDVRNVLQEKGYYTTSDGQDYFVLDIYFSDRVSGDIYVENHTVFVDENANLGGNSGFFSRNNGIEFNGVLDLGGANDPTSDAAELWATLTDGQLTLTDQDATVPPDDEPELDEAI